MIPPRLGIALNVAMWALFAQLFLSLGGLALAAGVAVAIHHPSPEVLITLWVGCFAWYVGGRALSCAKEASTGRGLL